MHSIKARNGRGSTDGNTSRFLPHGCRHRAGQGMVAELVDRRSQDDQDRSRHPAGRMADWNAAVPIARSRAMGGTQQARKQQNRTPDLFRGGRANWGSARIHQEDPENAIRRDRLGAKADEGDDEMSKRKRDLHWGSTLDDFLDEEGVRETAKAEAVTRVVAWQLSKEMKRQGMSKARLAKLMNTSRAQVDRILRAKGNVTIETLQRAAKLVGRQLRLELV